MNLTDDALVKRFGDSFFTKHNSKHGKPSYLSVKAWLSVMDLRFEDPMCESSSAISGGLLTPSLSKEEAGASTFQIEENHKLSRAYSKSSSSDMNSFRQQNGMGETSADGGFSDSERKIITVLRRKILVAKTKGNHAVVASLTRKLESKQQHFLRRQEQQVQIQKMKQFSRQNGSPSQTREVEL